MTELFAIASRISTPIALAGLVVMVLYAVIRQMLRSGIFPPLNQSAGGRAVNEILKGLFILSVVAMVLGFAGYIVSLFAPPRTSNLATAEELAQTNATIKQLVSKVDDLRSTDRLTREKVESLLAAGGDRPASDDLIESNRQLQRQLADAQALIATLKARSVPLPNGVIAAVTSAQATVRLTANAVGMVSASANIALRLIAPHTATAIVKLIPGLALDDPEIAGWSYSARIRRPDTRNWHFVDIPVGAVAYDPARDCPKGACIVAAIETVRAQLADRQRSSQDRADALKMLVGLMSDLHRPLHCATRNNDKGANALRVTLDGRPRNLHAVWDSDIFRARVGHEDVASYLDGLMASLTADLRGREAAGTVADWAWQSHQLAAEIIYPEIPPSGGSLSQSYLMRHGAIIDRQLLRAGIRLATVLDSVLG
jgi:hypothetical protein